MRILHFSDLHLGMENYSHIDPATGLSTRFSDWKRTMQKIVDYANEYQAEIVLFTGDAFKNRDPSPTYQNAFAGFIKELSEPNRQVILLVGNHDLPNIEHKAHTLEIYNSLHLPRVYVSKRIESFCIETSSGPLQIITWPWLTRNFLLKSEEYRGKSIEEIDNTLLNKATQLFLDLIEKLDQKIQAIALVHATIMGAKFGSERNVMIGKDLVLPLSLLANERFAYVACGHLHKHQVLCENPHVAYAGSPERIDFGEEKEDKGCILIDIEESKIKSFQFLSSGAREFYTWHISEPFAPPPKALNNCIVKIVISGDKKFVDSIHLDILQPYIKESYFFAGIERDIKDESNSVSTMKDLFQEAEKPEEMLEKYLEQKKIRKETMEKVLKRGQEIFSSTKES